jgi:hypothetical protein
VEGGTPGTELKETSQKGQEEVDQYIADMGAEAGMDAGMDAGLDADADMGADMGADADIDMGPVEEPEMPPSGGVGRAKR